MKNNIIILFGLVLIIGIVGADIFGIATSHEDISLDKIQTARIKEVADIDEIEIKIDKIRCDDNECWAMVYQEDLINTEWRRDKIYCSEYDIPKEINISNLPDKVECLTWTNYTLAENEQAIQDYAEKRINDWAVVEEVRQDKIVEVKNEIGAITEPSVIGIGG